MLDYLYRIKKKKPGQDPYFFFFSINKQHLFSYAVSALIQTERNSPLFMPFLRPLTRL